MLFNFFNEIISFYKVNNNNIKAKFKKIISKSNDVVSFFDNQYLIMPHTLTKLRADSILIIFDYISKMIFNKFLSRHNYNIITYYFNDNLVPLYDCYLLNNNIDVDQIGNEQFLEISLPAYSKESEDSMFNIAKYILCAQISICNKNESILLINNQVINDKYINIDNFNKFVIEYQYYTNHKVNKGIITENKTTELVC